MTAAPCLPVPIRTILQRPGLIALLLCGLAAPAGSQQPASPEATAFLNEVAAAWAAHDLARWMALWAPMSPEQRSVEETFARDAFASDQTTMEWLGPPQLSANGGRLTADAQVFTAREPHGHVAYYRLGADERSGRLRLFSREQQGQVEGLVHVSLARLAWRARGVSLRLDDFELRIEEGTLFSSPEELGRTALVFVGRGRVQMTPRPRAEREQLRRFAGAPTLDVPVKWGFVRIHPDDFERVVETARLEPEPTPLPRQEQRAQEIFRARSVRSFMLDASLPRSPWWLLPGRGDAIVDFPWHGRVLTFAVSRSEAEDVNLFDRDRRIQICVYASAGPSFRPERGGSLDVLDQQLAVRFEPERFELSAVHTMQLRARGGSTLRLRLDDDFRVSSVTTGDGAGLLFFRVRGQGTIVVSLGGLAARDQPFTLVTRYSGRHDPAPIEHELLQLEPPADVTDLEHVVMDHPPLVYSNRTAWYPRPPDEAFSPARLSFDTPEGWLAVTGGELLSINTDGKRTRAEFRQTEPGKFVTAVVGRFSDLGLRREGEQSIRSFATSRTREEALEQAQLAGKILAFYAERFGPCPYPMLGLAVTEAKVPGGHSPPGLVYLQRRPLLLRRHSLQDDPASFPELPDFILAHELAHQWFGQGAAPGSYRERWLSEAWAQYAAALWVQKRQGEAAFRGMMDRMARWAFRYDDAGPINLGQRLGLVDADPRIMRAVVYDKGAWVLHILRGIVGDTAFFAGARSFLADHRFAKVWTEDLREALEKASGQDLRPFFARWIYDTGLPRLLWSARSEPVRAGVRTVVEVRAQDTPTPLPVEVAVVTAAGRQARRALVDAAGASVTFDTDDAPRRIGVNEDRGLLARVERVDRLPEPTQR